MINQTPEQIARDKIDQMLVEASWIIHSKSKINLAAGKSVAVREYQTDVEPADFVVFVNRKPMGIIEAKGEDEGHNLTVIEEQAKGHAYAKLKYLNNDPLPYVYESTGTITRCTDYSDPKPRGRQVFNFHCPGTIAEWLRKEKSLRSRLLDLPILDHIGLRPAQIRAIDNLKKSEALRQSIIKQAFGGNLLNKEGLDACRQDPDWEPAEQLLKRIKKEK